MKRSLFILLPFLVQIFVILPGCGPETPEYEPVKLDAPEISVDSLSDSFVGLSWDAVEGASSYLCVLDGNEESVSGTSVEYEGLAPESVHTFMVSAVPGDDSRYVNSDWAEKEVALLAEGQEMRLRFLDMEILEITSYSIWLHIVPKDTMTYCVRIVHAEEFDKCSSEEDVFDADYEYFVSQSEARGMTLEEFIGEHMIYSLEKYFTISSLWADTEHVVYGYALDAQGNASPGISLLRFTTAKD